MICSFHRLCKNQQFPHDGFFFDEKETLEESNESSLIKLHWAAHFWFCFLSVYVVLSPFVQGLHNFQYVFRGLDVVIFCKLNIIQIFFSIFHPPSALFKIFQFFILLVFFTIFFSIFHPPSALFKNFLDSSSS